MTSGDRGRVLKNVETSKRCGGAELIGGVTVAVKKGFEFAVFPEECVKDRLVCKGSCHWQIAAGEPFGQGKKIRLHAFFMAGEEIRWEAKKSSLLPSGGG